MSIEARCSCGAEQSVPDEWAGRVARCESCGRTIAIHQHEPELKCPKCKTPMERSSEFCSACGGWSERRDLAMEGHLLAIALGYKISGALIGVTSFMLLSWTKPYQTTSVGSGELALLFISMAGAAAFFAIGVFLGHYSNAARMIAVFVTLLSILAPWIFALLRRAESMDLYALATLMAGWSFAVLWVLLNSRTTMICTSRYREIVPRVASGEPPVYGSPYFWIPFVGLFLLMCSIFA